MNIIFVDLYKIFHICIYYNIGNRIISREKFSVLILGNGSGSFKYNHMAAEPIMRAAVRLFLLFVIMVSYFILILLNIKGFCFSAEKFYSDEALIDIAINKTIMIFSRDNEKYYVYSSLQDFKNQNPYCCKVEQATDFEYNPYVPGFANKVVEIKYKDERSIKQRYIAYINISPCGDIGRQSGIYEEK